MKMRGRVYLRSDQIWDQILSKSQNPNITIYAPIWLKNGLNELSKYFSNAKFDICNGNGIKTEHCLQIGDSLTLKQLSTIARNESRNVTGIIDFNNYKQIVDKKYDML
jgi:hypothetical protein